LHGFEKTLEKQVGLVQLERVTANKESGPRGASGKFRSAAEAIELLRWDQGFEPSEFSVVCEQSDGLETVPLESFEPNGALPWSSVRSILRGERAVWDRELALDRLEEERGVKLERQRAPRVRQRAKLRCTVCAQPFETVPDEGGARTQSYVEDCAVCCRPHRVNARFDEAQMSWVIELEAES
jgi:hypothetical protein